MKRNVLNDVCSREVQKQELTNYTPEFKIQKQYGDILCGRQSHIINNIKESSMAEGIGNEILSIHNSKLNNRDSLITEYGDISNWVNGVSKLAALRTFLVQVKDRAIQVAAFHELPQLLKGIQSGASLEMGRIV